MVLDNDTRDTEKFRAELNEISVKHRIEVDHVYCIAVEEAEAWLLGDEDALIKAYPAAKMQSLRMYEQDSICGTWEILADVVYPGGSVKMKKDCPTYMEIGKYKSEWARRIGEYMSLEENKSPSFRFF